MAKTPVSRAALEQHLEDQLQFLEKSADAFDGGFTAEYRRMAMAIRVMVHNTNSSHSILSQLGKLNIDFIDTTHPLEADNILTYSGLTVMLQGGENGGFAAPLDDTPFKVTKQFADWWTTPVLKDEHGRLLSRQALILTAANQDGGGHVDPGLDEIYADISQRNSLGWVTQAPDGSWKELPGAERASIRQIAHEVLKSLKADYEKIPNTSGAGIVFFGASIRPASPHEIAASKNSQAERRVRPKAQGRNELCACGSGKKYKHCHGAL